MKSSITSTTFICHSSRPDGILWEFEYHNVPKFLEWKNEFFGHGIRDLNKIRKGISCNQVLGSYFNFHGGWGL